MGAGKGVVLSKPMVAFAGIVVVALVVGAGLIGHYAFPYEDTEDNDGAAEGPTTTTTEGPTTTTTSAPSLSDFRLPRSLVPTHYHVQLKPFINGNFSILGHVEIEIDVEEPTSNITIHMADIITFNDTIKVKHQASGDEVSVIEHTYDASREWYVGFLENELNAGDQILLEMSFIGYLNEQMRGFYRSSYVNQDGDTVFLATTQFQPTDARRAFPCFDEPALKANFTVELAREATMKSISNMPRERTLPIAGEPGWMMDYYETSVAMSTYLVAFVVSDFEYQTTTAGDVEFNVWARSEAIAQAEYAKEIGPETLIFFEDYFNIPYPLPKQDMIAIPDFAAGAMENWGLITYRETAMLYDDTLSAVSNKQRVGVVVVHELAHQWFGNLVTPTWWTDLWLNEGFASYMEYVGLNYVEPKWEMMDQFAVSDLHRVMAIDSLESSHPISIPVGHPDEINEIFDVISYSKGASIIRMMQHFLTEATFKKGLTNYLNAFAYDAAEQDDLWRYLTEAADEDGQLPDGVTVKDIMDTWTLQMGYPVLNVTRSQDGTTATVSQNRFLLVESGSVAKDSHTYMWWIPVSFSSASKSDFTQTKPSHWLGKDQQETTIDGLPSKTDWVILNNQETGYYRVNYDLDNWDAISEKLLVAHEDIHVINRAQLIDDSMTLARAGQLPYENAMSINRYLKDERHYVPWSAALTNFEYLEKMMTRTSGYGPLKEYVLNLLTPLYNDIGFADDTQDPHLDQYTRTLAVTWACKLGHPECVDEAVSNFQISNDTIEDDGISPNLKTTIFCTAIAEGGVEEWDAAWDRYLTSNVATEKDQILAALGCTREIWLLSRYLEWTFDETFGIRKQDARTAFRSVARNDVGSSLAWNYLKSNWEHISEYFGTFTTLGDLIAYASEEFNTIEQKGELEQFYNDHSDKLGTATRALEQAIEATANNAAWMENNYAVIVQWLEANNI